MAPRILLIDDTESIRTVARLVLERGGGFQVTVAASGEAGLEAARADPPELVLLDVMMPGIDGPETLRRLKADPVTAAIPVIFLTGSLRPEEVDHWLSLGAVAAVSKVDLIRLPGELRRIADEQEMLRAVAVLQAQYISELPGILEGLSVAVEGARRTPGDVGRLREAISSAHRVHGTAGCYELMAVADAAGRIEDALVSLRSGTSPDAAFLLVDHALSDLRRAQVGC